MTPFVQVRGRQASISFDCASADTTKADAMTVSADHFALVGFSPYASPTTELSGRSVMLGTVPLHRRRFTGTVRLDDVRRFGWCT